MLLSLLLAVSPVECASDQPVTLAFKANDSMERVAAWASKNLCEPYSVDPAVAKKTLPVTLQGTVSRLHARVLLSAALAAGEVTTRKEKEGVVLGARAPECDDAQRAAVVAEIHLVSEDVRSVSRAAFESSWTPCMTGAARVVPALKNGELIGLKLFAIRPDSVWAALGFRNGDVILDVNGHSLKSPDSALEAYTALRKVDQVHFSLERQGQPASVTVNIEAPKR